MKKYIFSITMILSSVALSSGYPSDYELKTDSPIAGNYTDVGIYRSIQSGGGMALEIFYKGKKASRAPVSVFVRVKYLDGNREALLPMAPKAISGGGIVQHLRLTNGCLVGAMGGCKVSAPPLMQHLLYWASSQDRLNALDIEFAFVDAGGNWDSHNRQNYQYRFGELRRY